MLWWLGQNTIIAALLAGVIALVCHVARPGPALRHALWLLVLIKMLTPPVVHWPWQVPGWGRWLPASVNQESPAAGVIEGPSAGDGTASLEAVFAIQDAAPAGQAMREGESSLATGEQVPGWLQLDIAWLSPALLGLWCSGTVLVAGVHLMRIRRFRGLLERARWPPGWLKHQVRELALRLRVRRPQTQVVPGLDSPSVWSLGRARLLWPEALLDQLPAGCRRSVVAHELAHLRRRDHWVGWLLLAAECVWWWNPLYWLVRRQLRACAELACDAWVIYTFPEDRRAYAEALIEVTQVVSRTAAPVPALGVGTGARQTLERRLTMIMREPVSCRLSLTGLVGVALLALFALPGWSLMPTAQADDPKPEPKPRPEKAEVVIFKFDEEADRNEATGKGLNQERDQRLRALEEQIQTLLKEVKALRGGDEGAGQHRVKVIRKSDEAKAHPEKVHVRVVEEKDGVVRHRLVSPDAKGQKIQVEAKVLALHLSEPLNGGVESARPLRYTARIVTGNEAVTLSRATYKLPHAKAEALGRLLRELVKAAVLETKVEGDTITVTTTPESQKAIGALIGLIQGKNSVSLQKPSGSDLTVAPKGERLSLSIEPIAVQYLDNLQLNELKLDVKPNTPQDAIRLNVKPPDAIRLDVKPLNGIKLESPPGVPKK